MIEAGLAVAGLVIGGVVAWVLGSRNSQRRCSELGSRLAAADSSAAEVRRQIAERDATVETLREQLDVERQGHVTARTRLEEAGKRFEEQQRLLSQAEKNLKESFESLSAKALQTNAEQFLQTAKKTLDVVLSDARGDLGKRQEAIKTLVQPIADSLKRYEVQIKSLESARQEAYGSLSAQVKTLTSTNRLLQEETGKLVTSLRDPKVRGRWGELALKRTAELAGMAEHCDFDQQVNVSAGDSRVRPDMVVHLPGGRTVVVDAKAVLDAYLDAVGATDEVARRGHLERHAAQVRSRFRELSGKAYWDKLPAAPEFVVLFLPGESFFSAAVEADPTLIEDAIDKRVVLASPTTLIALLRAVAYGWQQEQVAENAERISQLGRELFDRMGTLVQHLQRMGANLGRTVESFNQAVGSLESRVLPSARRFKELGAARGDSIGHLTAIDSSPRRIEPLDTGGDQH